MKYSQDKVEDIQIAYIGGGSRGWAWKLMGDLALEDRISGTVRLYDIDYDAAQANEKIGERYGEHPEAKSRWNYRAVKTIEEALQGADFVIISILPGSFEVMESDVHLPEKYGIYQSVGDTVGPGGLMRALRTVPMFMEFAQKIKEHAPKAWVINYTNPLTLCVRAMYEVFPDIRAIGCCHGVFDTQNLLVRMLKDKRGIDNLKRQDIKINVLGINHFTWIDEATWHGEDLLPLFHEYALEYVENGYPPADEVDWIEEPMVSADRVTFDLFLRYGLIPTTGDRHLAEFFPSWQYLKDPQTVQAWKFKLTPVSYRYKAQKMLREKSQKLLRGEESIELKPSGEEAVEQMMAILGLQDMITNINLPNTGQMKDFPAGAVVETNAWFTDGMVKPVTAGGLPPEIHALVMRHVWNQENLLQAILERSKARAFQSFINDPLVPLNAERAHQLFDEMFEPIKVFTQMQ